jgi:4-carboxymuconolactone decarboxylase
MTPAPEQTSFSQRLTVPRLAPVDKSNLTEAQATMLAARADYNIYKTLAHHPDLYARWSPLGQFLLSGSSLTPRHREIAMLRMGWLCQSEYEWSQHARIAKASAGMNDADVHRIAEGPDAAGWSDIDSAVIRMADELRYDAMVSDATWQALRAGFSEKEIVELVFTTAQYQLVSMALNTLGVQLDPELQDRLPRDLPLPPLAQRVTSPRLAVPRIAPIPLDQMTPVQRELVQPRVRPDGTLFNLYATLAHHEKMYPARAGFGSYLQRESLLPPETRELLIMRTGYLLNAAYEWAHHVEAAKAAGLADADIARIAKGPAATGWDARQRAVLSAADELRREAFITDATWAELSKHYDMKQMVEIIYTVGGYTMTALAINSFGVQVEPGYPAMPK